MTWGKLTSAQRAEAPTARELPHSGWTCLSGKQSIGLAHCAGADPPLTSGGCSCTVGRGQFPWSIKPTPPI